MSNKIKVGEHIRIIPGFPFNSALFNTDGIGQPLIRIRDLLRSKIETYYSGEFSNEFLINEGDILIGMDGDFHIVKWRNKRTALLNQRIMRIAQKEGALIDINYFYYFLFPFLKEVWDKTTATTVKHLSTYDISNALIEFPPLSYQKKASNILDVTVSLIEKTQAAIDKYTSIKQGMLNDLYTRGIDLKTGKLRPCYQIAPELYKPSQLGWIPKEWDEIRLENLSSQIGDGIHSTPKYSENTNYFFINGNNLNNGEISITDSTLCVSEEEYRKHFKELNNKTLLYSINGTIGNISFYRGQKVVLGKSVCYISCHSQVQANYIYFLLQTHSIIKFYENELTGSTIRNLSLASIRSTPIVIPKSEKEQEEIANRINLITKKIISEQGYYNKLLSIKSGLLSDLLGKKTKAEMKKEIEKIKI